MAKPSATFGNYMPKQFSGVEAPVGIHTRKNWYLKIAFSRKTIPHFLDIDRFIYKITLFYSE